MNKTLGSIACIVFLAVLMAVPSVLAQADQLIGVWKIIEVKLPANPDRNLEARTITDPQPGLVIFTKRHYSWQEVAPRKPRLDLPRQGGTDAQLLEVMRRFLSNGGPYEVKESTIILRPMVAKMPYVMAPDFSSSFDFKFAGNELILTPGKVGTALRSEFKLIRLE